VYFFERTSAPRLIIVWQPGFLTLEDLWYEETRVPLHYNLFFHPLIHWSDHPPGEEAYPWNFDSLNLPHRYLMGKPPTAAQPSPTQLDILRLKSKNKDMLKQLAGAEAPTIFVFPVGNRARWLRDIVAQKAALELLQEINHFLQRRAANELALHPIGRITVSGFSFGYHGPVGLMDDTPVPGFDDNWVEVYNFDGNEAGFVDPTRRWLQKRIGDRRVRIYTQSGIWLSLASRPPLSQALKISRFHATEIQSYAGTILHVPSQFWFDNFRVSNFDAIHQVIPALFLHSAAAGWFLV
jgi:hypothetical protein